MLETRARRQCLNYCSRAVIPLPRIVHESYHYNLTKLEPQQRVQSQFQPYETSLPVGSLSKEEHTEVVFLVPLARSDVSDAALWMEGFICKH